MKASSSITFALATVLFTSLFLVGTTSSVSRTDYGVTQVPEYDPWMDLNDDGTINLYDAVLLLTRYGSKGTPINKTELLLELQARMDALNATVMALEEQVALLGGGCAAEVGKFNGLVNSDMVETDPEGATTINFQNPFTSTDPPEMFVIVVLKQAANGLWEGAAIKAVESIKGSAGNWYGFSLTVSKYSDGSSISDNNKVFVTWMAVGTGSSTQPKHFASIEQLITTGNQITITFPVGMFTTAPNISATAFMLTGSHAGKTCYISNISVSATNATLSLQAWSGALWQDIADGETVQVSYTAVE